MSYAFSTAHIQGPIYQERGFQTAEGKEVKNLPEIRRLLEAVQLPRAVAIVHAPGHQKEDPKARGNRAADAATREVASRDYAAPILAMGLPPPGMGTLPPVPDYSFPDLAWINKDLFSKEILVLRKDISSTHLKWRCFLRMMPIMIHSGLRNS